jgi:hypothetical protein
MCVPETHMQLEEFRTACSHSNQSAYVTHLWVLNIIPWLWKFVLNYLGDWSNTDNCTRKPTYVDFYLHAHHTGTHKKKSIQYWHIMRQRLSLAESLREEIWHLPETFQQGDRKVQTTTDLFNTEESGLCRRDWYGWPQSKYRWYMSVRTC